MDTKAQTDAEDRRLLEGGEHDRLLAKYFPVVKARVAARLRHEADAQDVTQMVMLRLLTELRRGRTYAVPYRVVVHKVIGWTLREHWSGQPLMGELPEHVTDGGKPFDDVEFGADLEALLEELGGRTAEVCRLRYLHQGLAPEQIAERLGMTRNAVDQALWRGRGFLGERWVR